MSGTMIGAAQSDITPPVGVDLCGYGGRPGPSTAVHDELKAGALYVADGSRAVLLVTCDLVGLHHEDVASIRRNVASRTGVPAAHIMVSCSHTHAGPATRCVRYLGIPDEDYVSRLLEALVDTAAAAASGAVPGRLGWSRQPLNVGVNRRPRQTDKVGLGTGAEGVRDAAVDVLVADDEKGVPLARLFLHAAHAVALGSDNTMISADWPGAARRMVEAAYPGAVGLFMQGCCGNITCRERGWEGVESQGLRAAQAVAAGVGSQAEMPDLRVNGTIVPLALPLKPFPSVDRAEAALAAFTVHLRELPAEAHRGIRWMAEGAVEWAERILAAARTGQDAGSVPFDVQALQLGDVAIVGLPGEAFVEYALNIAADSPFAHTMVAAYANGNVGYIPTAAAHPEGGYEVNNAIRYYGLTMPRPEAEELILNAAAVALRELA